MPDRDAVRNFTQSQRREMSAAVEREFPSGEEQFTNDTYQTTGHSAGNLLYEGRRQAGKFISRREVFTAQPNYFATP